MAGEDPSVEQSYRFGFHRLGSVLLVRHAPEAEVARVLDQLPDGELQHLAHALAHAAERRQDQEAQQATVPPGQPGSSAATPTRP